MEEVTEVEAVLEFLRKNGFSEAETALREDMVEKRNGVTVAVVDGEFDFERFLFPMVPPPPPVRVPATGFRRSEVLAGAAGNCSKSSTSSSSDEFVSLGSSSSNVCSSEFTNPYGIGSTTGGNSKASSERLSAFGTARDCHDFDMQNDLYWYDEKDEGYFMTPCFNGSDPFYCPTEDKFVTTLEREKPRENLFSSDHEPEVFQSANSNYLDKPCLFNIIITATNDVNKVPMTDDYHIDKNAKPENGVERELDSCAGYRSSAPLCECGAGEGGSYGQGPASYSQRKLMGCDLNDIQFKGVDEAPTNTYSSVEQILNNNAEHSIKMSSTNNLVGDFKSSSDLQSQDDKEDIQPNRLYGYDAEDDGELFGDSHEPKAAADDEDGVAADELLTYNTHEEEYEVFDLRIIHRKNRTGFEENKELPIVLNTIIAGRYYVTEYLGSAAFSRVVQAHDFHTGIDVCLKIIKNDKDFFDQSLDEIKLLKFVNKHDPADERHILRLYDYFYHQEHLFIVCEVLRANLYEFQKFNQDSDGEFYFTLSRLQVITRQCLEALEYLHHLGIIHCDLKPENILIKSYRRCEIKIIDLGSSCFQTDNLCLYVQSRSYRAPEVILGLPYDQKIDIWSLGCILAELCSGEVLFPNDALVMILARMIGILGPIDVDLLVRGQETDKYFTSEFDLYHINEETSQLEYIILEESSLERHLKVSDIGFIDFVKYLLQFDSQKRPTAKEALQHPWLSHSYE